MEPMKWALQALDIIESETRDLVPAGAPSTPKSETDVEIAPLVQQVGATSIAEIEKMISDTVAKWREAGHPLRNHSTSTQFEVTPFPPEDGTGSVGVPDQPSQSQDKSEPGPEGRTPEACWQASKCGDGR